MSKDPLVIWVNPEEFEFCQTKPIIMDEHNELLNGMPRQIVALAAMTDHCSLALTPITPPAAQVQGEQEAWLPMETAPKDGTLLRLLVEFEDHPIDDGTGPFATVGTNYRDNTGIDTWQLVGWCWEQDQFIDGVGTPIGWLPMLSAPPAAGVPEGYVLAPIKPTIEMVAAGYEASLGQPDRSAHARVIEQYDAMLAEAPPPPASEQWHCQHCNSETAQACRDGGCFGVDAEPASEQQQAVVMPVAILIDTLKNTRETIDGQLEIIAARAHGSHLDKAPVVRSLRAHRARCDEALAEYNRELLRLNPHLQPAAPSQGVDHASE